MKRRTFVRDMALAGVGIGAAGLSACSTSAKKDENTSKATTENTATPFFKLSLAQWSIHGMIQRDNLDPYQFATLAKKWGFEGLDC